MNRREFLALGAAAAPLGSAAPERRAGAPDAADLGQTELRRLRDQYRRDLFDDFLPFVERYVLDEVHGGFMCSVDPSGARHATTKSAWFEGRGIWVFAFLYHHIAREQRFLDIAARSVALLDRVPRGADGLWPKTFTREGVPLASGDGEIYGNLFIAEGLAAYAQAAAEPQHWDRARALILEAVDLYDRTDYRPAIGQTYLGLAARPFPGARILGVWMVLLRVLTPMLEQRRDAALEALADRAVRAITEFHYNPAFDLFNELVEHDGSRPPNEYAQLVYTGHCIEMLWMLGDEARRRGDRALTELAARQVRRHLDVARDDVYGGAFRNLQRVDENVWSLDKVLWLQEEILIATLGLVSDPDHRVWAWETFHRTDQYVRATYPLRARGVASPVWIYAGDRRVSLESVRALPARLENYHHPRHLMINLLAVERLLGAAG